MSEYFVVYDNTTGAVRWRGEGPSGITSLQTPPPGLSAVKVPQAALLGEELDLAPMKAEAIEWIDARAEAIANRFLTPGSAQMATYLRKEAEARAWTPGADPTNFPFLSAVAAATDVTLEALVAEVLALADAWVTIGALIDATRMKAKKDVRDAPNLLALIAAANVDWSAIPDVPE